MIILRCEVCLVKVGHMSRCLIHKSYLGALCSKTQLLFILVSSCSKKSNFCTSVALCTICTYADLVFVEMHAKLSKTPPL